MIRVAAEKHPGLRIHAGNAEDADVIARIAGPFDYIVISDTIGLIRRLPSAARAPAPLRPRPTGG